MKKIILALLLAGGAQRAGAQVFGGLPPYTRWKMIDSDTARVIYTDGAREQAERIATLIHRMAADTAFAIGPRLRKIPILLQSRTTIANGYVALAPFRSEFYLIPSSNVHEFGNLPWQDNLALHEYRHVQQYANFRNGLSKAFYYLFGQGGQALANGLSVPDWFFEGDAVYAETALTQQGRGRLPYFLGGYNSLWLAGKDYRWMKLRNGSLKDYVPDHYQLGYLLANYGYLKYGPQFWDKVTHDASAFKGLIYPFQQAVKRYAGIDYKTFRREAFDYYRQKLGKEAGAPAPADRKVESYFFARQIGADSLLYLKTAYDRIPAFYLRTGGRERRIALQRISTEEWFSYRAGRIAYTSYSTHPRWGLVDYQDIVLLSLDGRDERRLTRKARYFTPDLSPSGNRLVAVRITDSLQTELQVLLTDNGEVQSVVRSAADEYFLNPRYVDEGRIAVVVRTPDSRSSLQLIDLDNPGQRTTLVPPSYNTLGSPFVAAGRVYFVSNASGNDDVFSVSLKDKKILQLTQDLTGNYYPSVWGDSLLVAHFTAQGLRLQPRALAGAPVSPMTWTETALRYPVAESNPLLPVFTRRFGEKRYSQSTGFFNFHSWTPNYIDPEFSFTLQSDNVLNSFSNELYYRYNQNERSHAVGWNTIYGGLYPQLRGGMEYKFDRQVGLVKNVASLDEFEARLGYAIPFNFSQGKTYKRLTVGSNFVFNQPLPRGPFKDSLSGSSFSYLQHYFTWSQLLPRARQHIFPKLGLTATGQYLHSLATRRDQLLLTTNLYLPSVANHSIVLNAGFQVVTADPGGIAFSNRFALSRGYVDYYFSKMWKLGANYHFPLLYPDFGLASIVYLQRLRGNAFFDYSRVFTADNAARGDLRSIGGELYFDTKWWNQLPVTIGLRVSHLLDNGFAKGDAKGSNYFELILPVSLIPR